MDIKKTILWGALAVFIAGTGFLVWFLVTDMRTYVRYANEKEGISMKYPKDWKVVPYPDTGAIVVFVKPKTNAMTEVLANWNISSTPLQVPLTLEEYAKAADAQVKFLFKEVNSSSRPVRLSGHKGLELLYISPKDDGLVFISYVFLHRGVAYNISYLDEKEAYQDPKRRQSIANVIHSLKVNF